MGLFLKPLELAMRAAGRVAQPVLDSLPGASEKGRASPGLEEVLESGARVMWVAAHPDDESLAGPVLARAGQGLGNPLYFLVLTHGDGGESAVAGVTSNNLWQVRGEEMKKVARLYNAELQHERFWNAPLPVESFPARQEIAARWCGHKDPIRLIAEAIRRFRPDVLLTLAPVYGGTGHPEHQLTARFATSAIQLAADEGEVLAGSPHRVAHTYYLLNRLWLARLIGLGVDPLPHTEVFDVRRPGVEGRTCAEVAADNTLPHRTQGKDMGQMRFLLRSIHKLHLHRVDPFTEGMDPFEKRDRGGMG